MIMKNKTNAAKVLKHFRENKYNRPEPISKYEMGGANECRDVSGKPKPRCFKKFRSKSSSGKGIGALGNAIIGGLAGLGAYGGYKYLKSKENN